MEKRHIIKFILAVLVFMLVIFSISSIGPERIVEMIGFQNIYPAIFIFAIIGGVSAVSAAGFYATVFSLSAGGADPFILALFSAPGVLIGDFVFWYLGAEGRKAIGEDNKYFTRLERWFSSKPRWFIPVGTYLYTGFTPFPGDLLMVVLAFMKIKFRYILLPTLFGNFTLALIVAFSAKFSGM